MPLKKIIISLLLIFLSASLDAQSISEKLSAIPGLTFNKLGNRNFSEYYEVFIEQLIDHDAVTSKKFRQRLILGFRSFDSLTVMDTDGYAINYAMAADHKHELAGLLNANLIHIEHRFFGNSIPDSIDYTYLTTAQAAADIHYIRTIFSDIFRNKWISTGISKGGQAALAHKIKYPSDVAFTLLYGTAVKKALIENKINEKLDELAGTECGKKLSLFQNNLLKNKAAVLSQLDLFILKNGILLGTPDKETALDYMILELPFSFWQSGADCKNIPLSSDKADMMFNYLSSVISPSFYSLKTLKRLQPSFYMSYHELGYYEYETKKFKKYLKQNNYSNRNFAPSNMKIKFDPTYLNSLNDFLKTPAAAKILFVYGENDPWAAMQETGRAGKIVVRNGSHKSRIKEMSEEQKALVNKAMEEIRH
jgi:pimeloyl-ACP methyl ester carboxylesterase